MNAANLQFKGLLLDLDGTLYVGDRTLPGVARTLAGLADAGVAIRYLTNTTSKTRAEIVAHAAGLGLVIPSGRLYTPPLVARDVLRAAGHRRCHFLLRPEVVADLDGLTHVDESPDAVVVGDLGDQFAVERLDLALRFLLEGVPFYTLARNRRFQSSHGARMDVGAYTVALEYAADRTATLLGKPAAQFFATALADLGLGADEVLMIGDDIEGDVAGAQAAGIRGVLVRTGKFREGDLARGIVPDAVLDSFAELNPADTGGAR